MEAPPANSELELQLSTTQLTPAAAWHVLGLLLSHGRPAHPSELASSLTQFYPTPEFIRFLCSIPNSPLRFADNHFVTFSQVGVAAIAQFFANSDLITRYMDLPQVMPRLLENVRSSDIVRTYYRKRKRPTLDIEDFPLMKKKSFFKDFNEELNLNRLMMPGGFQKSLQHASHYWFVLLFQFANLNCILSCNDIKPTMFQGVETLSTLSLILEYDSMKLEKVMFGPPLYTKTSSGQLSYVGHEYDQMEIKFPNRRGLGYLHRKSCKSYSRSHGRFPNIHKTEAEEIMNYVPLPQLSLLPHIMGNSEGSKIGDVDIVNPINSINISSFKLEVDDQMTVSQEENEAGTQGCGSSTEDVNGKRKEASLHDSGRCRHHKENQPMDTTCKSRSHIDNNPEKTLGEANNEALFLVTPRTDSHLQNQGDMPSHIMESSSITKPNHKDERYDKKKALCPTMENFKRLPEKGPVQIRRDKNPTEKQHRMFNGDQNMNTKEKRETSMENRKKVPSISNNHVEQKPFPDFESFVVEEEEGSGGYGTVYRARRKTDGVTFAIKFIILLLKDPKGYFILLLLANVSPEAYTCPHDNANRNYVINEMKMLERLRGKNFVIKYEGSFKSGNADYLVLEHVEHDRPEILKREINTIHLQWYGYCLFKALAGLHKQGIVHRDVKPGNFLYSRKANKGYLIDFNLALDMHKKYGTVDKARHNLTDPVPTPRTISLPLAKGRKLMNTRSLEAVNKNAGKVSTSLLPPGNLKKKVDKAKAFTNTSSRNIIKSQGADGSGITSAKDATSTKTPSAERLREPIPSQGRRELLSLVQEAMQGGNHDSVNAPISKRKRVAASPGDSDNKFLYPTPMPLHANGIAICGAGLLKSKGDGKPRREGPCVGTKGFKAPEVLFRSLHQGPKADIWSAGVTLLYLMIGRTPFMGDSDQNIKEIAKLRGSEDLWEVAKLHNHESVFPTDLLDVKYLSPVKLWDWCARNTRRPDFLEAIPKSLFDLVDKCLIVNPRHRISAEEALSHDFFMPCHEALRKQRLRRQGLNLDSGESHTYEVVS
ncbi:hypothetical protein DH2020_044009 [Rehmannia glutinosa]|uniref:non-specific serine/threonine protein kinase n=1 Tax=Rehmannia glutinosa TaxID=99300 RepID=A0ABR0UI36_REHGL